MIRKFLGRYDTGWGIRKCVLKARVSVTGFYEKLGYHTVEDIMPDDVPHIMMEKCLDVV